MEYFIEKGAEATLSPETQETALHEAVRAGHINIVELLLQKLPALLALDDHPGYNSFHVAAKHGHARVMEFLLRIADENEQQRNMLQAPTVSLYDGRVVFRQESNRSASSSISLNPSLPDISINPYMQSVEDLRTPLHEAASHGCLEVVKIYLEYIKAHPLSSNSSIDITEDPAATPTVSYTASPMHFPTRQLLVHPAVDMLTLLGRTAFHEAAKINNFEIMEALLDAGADINAVMRPYLDRTANADLTALVMACMGNDVDTVRFLLQHGATDARGKALGRSIKFKKDKVIGLILAFNNNVVATSEDRNVLPTDMSAYYDKILLDLNWNSKNLPYLNEQWLKMVIVESPHPRTEFCAISELDVSSNSLQEVPLAVFQLEHLLSMDLSRNKISVLPVDEDGCGWNCPSLRSVDIHNNQITQLPSCLFCLPKLKELSATENCLTYVPIEMWSAPKLKQLRLGRNQIVELPSKPINLLFNSPELLPQTPSESSPADVNVFPYDATTEVASPDVNQIKPSPQHIENSFSNVSFAITSSQIVTPESRSASRSMKRKTSSTASITNRLTSRRQAAFQDLLNDGTEELETLHYNPEEDASVLEILDLSCNKLTKVPFGLCCLAPKLKKLNLSGNQIENLGHIIDYPSELEVYDACNNDAISAIAFDGSYKERANYVPFMRGFCPRKLLTTDSIPPMSKPCGHWHHKTLSKLSTLKLNSNKLVELELFRIVLKRRSCDLSIEEDKPGNDFTLTKRQTADSNHSSSDSSGHGSMRDASVTSQRHTESFSKSIASPILKSLILMGNTDNTSGTSSNAADIEENSVRESVIPVAIFPELASLEIADNKLKSVPPYLHLCTHLASLNISHNFGITTLPLELSNLEHLWNLEYDDVPLVNPPAEDLDKYRIASDKLQYMRSLLHQ